MTRMTDEAHQAMQRALNRTAEIILDPSEIETLRARVAELEPIPTNGEHSDKCWQRAGHHHCAVLRIHKLERELAGYRKAERDMNEALNMGDGSYRP